MNEASMNKTKYEYLHVSLPKDFIEMLDRATRGKGYASRAEYLKYLVRRDLEQHEVHP